MSATYFDFVPYGLSRENERGGGAGLFLRPMLSLGRGVELYGEVSADAFVFGDELALGYGLGAGARLHVTKWLVIKAGYALSGINLEDHDPVEDADVGNHGMNGTAKFRTPTIGLELRF
ncbi:MAG: hypothetical protein AB1486_03560 [Planctomycetota bacterium]